MSDIQKTRGKYSIAFDHLWEALYLVNKTNNDSQKAVIHRKLSILYDQFNKDEESLVHLEKALYYSKEIIYENNNNTQQLNASYLNLANRQRRSGNYNKALQYLDSCVFTEKMIKNKSYIATEFELEKGNLLVKIGDLKEANDYLLKIKKLIKNEDVKYKIRVFSTIGELKIKEKEIDSAIFYFENSLKLTDNIKTNKFIILGLYSNLSKAYNLKNNTKQAYNYLVKKNKLTDSLNRIKNNAYGEIFEIKNSYLASLREKETLLIEQKKVIEQNKQTQFKLKIILALVFILGIVLFWVSRMRLKLKKSLLDKAETELQSKLDKEKSEEAIELKSKELTSYALQLIDKDSAIDDLLKILKEKSPSSFKSLSAKYKKGAKDLWDEFNLRFTEVNSDFYNRLKLKHPNLTITEQKHSALIKLKFNTKEMARILNIEPHSVHISRSRIRKKLGLERSDSLEDYISKL
ncbi:DUF2225 domain-containing protein [Lutibacter sp. TH_r2]|uniref:DUF2225 domain-containing protein n=1 Tax=Lutibacter sp. TH_r2 TaxID=3082083 RepID=UPI002953106C|nr:DUF2225 domain-containing protein [Lutibacter sp. TH_r2]MDV7185908.1 DUF2225 domain-containing protein [Lutibacter sp. TH_r2]